MTDSEIRLILARVEGLLRRMQEVRRAADPRDPLLQLEPAEANVAVLLVLCGLDRREAER